MHSASVKDCIVARKFSLPRSSITLAMLRGAADSTISQQGALNQFHAMWHGLIRRFNSPSAICGYTSIANAMVLLKKPLSFRFTQSAVFQALTCVADVKPEVEAVMEFIQRARLQYVATHQSDFAKPHDRNGYEKAWVANYEISDYLRSLPPPLAAQILFIRFNQWPELHGATHEERVRLTEEKPFGRLI